MPNRIAVRTVVALSLAAGGVFAAEQQRGTGFLHRFVPDINEAVVDYSTPSCHYKPIFGLGDVDAKVLKGIVRFGEMTLDPRGISMLLNDTEEEQVYLILEGEGVADYGEYNVPLRKNDYIYLPPGGMKHGMANGSEKICRLLVMGFRVPAGTRVKTPAKPLLANLEDVAKQVVGGHPASTLYQLLMGDTESKRDKLAAAAVLKSLFTMEFAPGGTNSPHRHSREEEIYLVLNGHGEMVAGDQRYPAKAGDAYYFAPNCRVGFYSGNKPGEAPARILAVRSVMP